MSDTLVIIPTYNEKENAEPIAKAVLAACPEADLLFVDDNSPDGTGQLAELAGVTRMTATRALSALSDESLVEWQGTSKRDPRAVWALT